MIQDLTKTIEEKEEEEEEKGEGGKYRQSGRQKKKTFFYRIGNIGTSSMDIKCQWMMIIQE